MDDIFTQDILEQLFMEAYPDDVPGEDRWISIFEAWMEQYDIDPDAMDDKTIYGFLQDHPAVINMIFEIGLNASWMERGFI